MSAPRCSKQALRLHRRRFSCTSFVGSETAAAEYVDKPQYPKPLPKYNCPAERVFHEWVSRIDTLPTIEQKLLELNMPKYYGFASCLIDDDLIPLNGGDLLKYVTRTQIVKGIPDHYHSEFKDTVESVLPTIRDQIEEVILLQFGDKIFRENLGITRKKRKGDQSFFIQNLNLIFMQELSKENPTLDSAVVDINPRIQNFWFVGGYEPPPLIKVARAKLPSHVGDLTKLTVNHYFRGKTRPLLVLRSEKALPQVVPLDDTLSTTGEIPVATLNPLAYGYNIDLKRAVILPGFWPGEQNEHALLFLHTREKFDKFINAHDGKYLDVGLQNWIMGVCFTQASSYGFYQGISPATDVVDPLTQQSVFTDGQKFTFCLYQMNTSLLHSEHASNNPRNNILWMSEDMSLFETIEDGKVRGFNDDVLRLLICMYLKQCQKEYALPAHGYKYLKDHDAPVVRKEAFQKFMLHLLSERIRRGRPEIYTWENIYKIKFKTRHIEPKRRFFEVPWRIKSPAHRRLDDYLDLYIPKCRRIHPRIERVPKIHSEKLFKYDPKVIQKFPYYSDDIIFQTLNKKKQEYLYDKGWQKEEEKSFFWDNE